LKVESFLPEGGQAEAARKKGRGTVGKKVLFVTQDVVQKGTNPWEGKTRGIPRGGTKVDVIYLPDYVRELMGGIEAGKNPRLRREGGGS